MLRKYQSVFKLFFQAKDQHQSCNITFHPINSWTILSAISSFTVLNNANSQTTVVPDLDAFQANVVEGAAKVSFSKFFSATLNKTKQNKSKWLTGWTTSQEGDQVISYHHRWGCWRLRLARWRTRRGWQDGPQGGTDGVPHPRCHRRTVAFYRVNEVSCNI